MVDKAVRVSIDQLTQSAFSGVLAAMEERKMDIKTWPGPIIVGIIAWPELGGLEGRVNLPGGGTNG